MEPASFYSDDHSAIFSSALSALRLFPASVEVNDAPSAQAPLTALPFDLIVFPEAFLDSASFVTTIQGLSQMGLPGLIHVGLRPGTNHESHLFSPQALKCLSTELRDISGLEATDLDQFDVWLATRIDSDFFNLGCVFGIDASGAMRACLHVKMVGADVEASPIPDQNVTEANLLSLITLEPTDKKLKKVVIQPLICSDAVEKSSLNPAHKPLQAMASENQSLLTIPDDIDLVSVVTCTPQPDIGPEDSQFKGRWHEGFRTTFQECMRRDTHSRHHYAAFVLANYRKVPDAGGDADAELTGGLSGTYFPRRFKHLDSLQDFIVPSVYGRSSRDHDDYVWGNMNNTRLPNKELIGSGILLGLAPKDGDEGCSAFMLEFSLHRLPRHAGQSNMPSQPITAITRWTRGPSHDETSNHFRVAT